MSIIFIFIFAAITTGKARAGCPGCVTRLTGGQLKDAESLLNFSLNKLATTGGPYYSLIKVNAATTQIVAGVKYVIYADLSSDINFQTKTCRITIWSRPWLPNGTEVNFECPEEEKITRRHGS